jgi:hypothetical protein
VRGLLEQAEGRMWDLLKGGHLLSEKVAFSGQYAPGWVRDQQTVMV